MKEKFERQLQVGGWVLIAVFVLGGFWLWKNIDRMQSGGNLSDTITVSGTGKVVAKPDIAVADLSINVEAATAAAAQTNANKKSKAVVAFLKDKGIEERDIRTSGYNIYPQYDYNDGKTRIRGYQVTQSLTVKIRDLDKSNTVLDGVVDAGVNQVSSIRFDIDEPDKLKAEAREKAIKDANEKAQELRKQLGVKLGRIVSFSENASGVVYPTYMKLAEDSRTMGMGGATSAVPAPEIPAGENEIVANVSITYQIK